MNCSLIVWLSLSFIISENLGSMEHACIFLLSLFIIFFFNQVQLTDFENAAFVAFIVLLTRAILSFHLNLLIPLSKVSTKTKGKPRIR